MRTAFWSLVVLPLYSFPQHFDFNKRCQAAYHEIFSLRLEKGKTIIAEEKREHPGNLIPLLVENYMDFLEIVISEDESLMPSFKTGKNRRLSTLKTGNTASPWFRHAQAETHLHYALAAIMFREYVSGMMELRKAYLLLEENVARHPDFHPSKKSLYVIESLLGVIPEKYLWGLRLLGLNGNLMEGMQRLNELVADDWKEYNFLRDEAALTCAMLLLHLKGDRKGAWEAVKERFPSEGNLFSYYAAVKIAIYSHHNEEALAMLEKLPAGNEYAPIPVMEYYKGMAKLHRLDITAVSDFEQFLAHHQGKNLIKSTYQKIAWAYLIQGLPENYRMKMNAVLKNGTEQAEADKLAQREAENAAAPYPELLKARLLFDGGYFKEAMKILENIPPNALTQPPYQLELAYRQARILDETGDTARAIERYMNVLSIGKNEPYYYAANAALHLGLIYESRNNRELAKKYFNECLSMQHHEYKNSLTQKAKAGLQRIR